MTCRSVTYSEMRTSRWPKNLGLFTMTEMYVKAQVVRWEHAYIGHMGTSCQPYYGKVGGGADL